MAQKVKILAIDTATDFLSAALFRDERVVAEKTAFVPRRHSALLPQFVDDVLRTAGEKFSDEIVLAISIGPGSYTGLRVGTSFVQGLCAAAGNRIVAVDTLMALAFRLAPSPVPVLVALDARAGGIYAGIFNVQGTPIPVVESGVFTPEQLHKIASFRGRLTFVGDRKLFEPISKNTTATELVFAGEPVPSAGAVAALAYKKVLTGEFIPPENLEPHYLREFVPGRSKRKIFGQPDSALSAEKGEQNSIA